MDNDILIELTADIVSAHLGRNRVEVGDVARVIQSVYDGLAKAALPSAAAEALPDPAVSIRSSIKAEAIVCLECGAQKKMLKRHLAVDHGLSPGDYRKRWSLPIDYPLVAPNYAERRRAIAHDTGLGRKGTGERRTEKPSDAAPVSAAPLPEAAWTDAE